MNVIVCALWSLMLTAVGYFAVLCCLTGKKKPDRDMLAMTRGRVLYLFAAAVSCAVLILLFENVYHLKLMAQLRLLSLVLAILPVAAVDLRLQRMPNSFLLSACGIRCGFYLVELIQSPEVLWSVLKDNLLGAVVIGGFFLLLLLIFKNSIGMGDVKLFALMGLYQGLWGAVNSVFFSLVVSFFLSLGLLITKKKGRKDLIPFGPSIFLGTVLAIGLAGM